MGGGDADGAALLEKWTTDPLSLSPTPGAASAGPGARLAARGVAQDKASVVCQLAAIEALLNGPSMALPCGVKVGFLSPRRLEIVWYNNGQEKRVHANSIRKWVVFSYGVGTPLVATKQRGIFPPICLLRGIARTHHHQAATGHPWN